MRGARRTQRVSPSPPRCVHGVPDRGPPPPPLGHGAPVTVPSPEAAAAAAAAERGAAGRPGPRRAHRERRPRAEPPVRGLPRVRVHAARPAGPAEDGLQPGRTDGDPPAAGGAPGPVRLLARGALRTLPRCPSSINTQPSCPRPVSLLRPPSPPAPSPAGPAWASLWALICQLSMWVEALRALSHDVPVLSGDMHVRPLGWLCTHSASPPPGTASCPPACVGVGAAAPARCQAEPVWPRSPGTSHSLPPPAGPFNSPSSAPRAPGLRRASHPCSRPAHVRTPVLRARQGVSRGSQ